MTRTKSQIIFGDRHYSLPVPELGYHKPYSLPIDATSQPILIIIRSLYTRTAWIRPDAFAHLPNYQDFHHYNSELLVRQRRSWLCVMKVLIKTQHLKTRIYEVHSFTFGDRQTSQSNIRQQRIYDKGIVMKMSDKFNNNTL